MPLLTDKNSLRQDPSNTTTQTRKAVRALLLLWCMLLIGCVVSRSQSSNALLDRDFWKQSPSLAQVKASIEAGNDPAELNRFAFDPVVYAVLENAPMDVLKLLLEQEGNEVNKITHDGRTFIFWAAYKDNLPLMQHLLDAGAHTDIIDDHGYSILNFSAVTGQKNPKLYDLMLSNGASLTEKNTEGATALLLLLPHLKNEKIVAYFTEKGLSLSDKDNHGNGAFHYATKGGNVEMLQWLIDQGVDHQYVNDEGGNAMLFASMGMRGHSNSVEVFQLLESKGIEANIVTKSGETPLLLYAADGEDPRVFKFLRSKGANPDLPNEDGNTALMLAAAYNNAAAVKLLLATSKKINTTNKQGQTALMLAVQHNTTEVVQMLLESSADPVVCDHEHNNLMHYLVKSHTRKTTVAFEEKRALLNQQGLSLTTAQGNGNNLYHLAAVLNNMELLRGASEMGLNINAKNKEGMTPLHIAAMKAQNDVVLKFLMRHGADESLLTAFDESAHDLALENEVLGQLKTDLKFLEIQ